MEETAPTNLPPPAAARANANGDSVMAQRRESFVSQNSQTASDYIDEQLRLEADAREALPYSFDNCTRPLGALRQSLFSCLTCNPLPSDSATPYNPAGVCYSCSISCHGEHELVELFTKRDFTCDCGTLRLPSTSPCVLRTDPVTGDKGVHSEEPSKENKYNQNFRNRFCGCSDAYDPHQEKGTMFQCLGIGSIETGGCGEDWWHPECLRGLPRVATNLEDDEDPPYPPGFPDEDDFETFICYKCLDANPWLRRYAGTPGFLPPVYLETQGNASSLISTETNNNSSKTPSPSTKKRELEDEDSTEFVAKKAKKDPSEPGEDAEKANGTPIKAKEKHELLPLMDPKGTFSLFLKEDFRDHLCRCAECFPDLKFNPQLREEEDVYEPPLSENGDGQNNNSAGSIHTGSLLDRGEAALSNIDRVKAIEGVMVYNHLRDKVKEFLKPFAESGKAVGAEDIKSYFEKLRGDDQAIQEAGGKASISRPRNDDGSDDNGGDSRREQSGY